MRLSRRLLEQLVVKFGVVGGKDCVHGAWNGSQLVMKSCALLTVCFAAS